MESWAAQVVSVQTSVKPATRIDTQEKDGAEGEHYQNSKGQESIGQVLLPKVFNCSIIVDYR